MGEDGEVALRARFARRNVKKAVKVSEELVDEKYCRLNEVK